MQSIFSEFPWIYMLSLIKKKQIDFKNQLGFGNQLFLDWQKMACLLYLRLSNSIMETPRPQRAA